MSPILIADQLEKLNLHVKKAKFRQKIVSEFSKNDHCASPHEKPPMNLEVAVIV